MITPIFPDDFTVGEHPMSVGMREHTADMSETLKEMMSNLPLSNAKRWVWQYDGKDVISIIGGPNMLTGDGETTFEMYDYREANPMSMLTAEDINKHLKANPFQ